MWRVAVDTGGTFTDAVGTDPDGKTHVVKVLSHSALRGELPADARSLDPREHQRRRFGERLAADFFRDFELRLLDDDGAYELRCPLEVPLLAAHLLTGIAPGDPLPPLELRLATTLGTNALLERRGVRTAFFVTAGFEDLLEIGDQQRPDLFALDIVREPPLHAAVVGVDARVAADGRELRPLVPEALDGRIDALLADGIDVAAVALLHGDVAPGHERALAAHLARRGFRHVSVSHELAARVRLLPRAWTAVVDAYLGPVVRGYLERVAGRVGGGTVYAMTSAGGLLAADAFRPKDSLLSGPAGGVVGTAEVARRLGIGRAIGFDMGGTSTDVARWDGDFRYRFSQRVAGRELLAPAVAIETVAAGGGSICAVDGRRLKVGPQSAGADPGPACYGAGGPLTITDVDLLLGDVDAEGFDIPIRPAAASGRLDELCAALRAAGETVDDPRQVLLGLREIADEHMAAAIRRISVREGYDPADHVLVAFGGAGGQHAVGVAERLGIDAVVVPARAPVLSAIGVAASALERFAERQVLEPLDACRDRLDAWFDGLGREATAAVGSADARVRRRALFARYVGQDTSIELPYDDAGSVATRFEERFAALYGHRPRARAIEVETLRVVASTEPRTVAGGGRRQTSIRVGEGWRAETLADGDVRLTRTGDRRRRGSRPEAVRVELFRHRFEAVVREMGERLERTAISTNVKERLDFSCALLDADGRLIVNAPHIPVHLGALGLCVRRLAEAIEMRDGDTVITNHPAYGGSHLPDVTLVTPVFHDGERVGFVANRAHHAEIGGTRPGSMPPDATRLIEEGVVFAPRRLVRDGEVDEAAIETLLTTGPHPSRNPADNLADLRAALAANHTGVVALRALCDAHGAATVARYMGRLTALAEERMRAALRSLAERGGPFEAEERLDDGSPLRVSIAIDGDGAVVDFAGSADVHPGNLNATPAIVRSAVLYVMRLLVDRPLPLNEGLLAPVRIVVPPGLLNPDFGDDAARAPAVVGGNVETSQRLVDVLLRALGLAACSQGTMNNVLFGNERFGYYETIGGGAGATARADGAHGVHTHMTNTRITDAEIVERRYPVRIERFARRRGSGGDGRRRGGDGLVREYTFLAPLQVSLLTQHRREAPYGLAGGGDGARGAQRCVRADGTVEALDGTASVDVGPGDRLVVETPGGGGHG